MTEKIAAKSILGDHHQTGLSYFLSAGDTHTETGVPHRALTEADGQREGIVKCMREMLIRHHVSLNALERDRLRREAMSRLGYNVDQDRMKRFPTNPSTQKGNLAEVILTEYLASATDVELPVYRLRYNPNVDQSMKGDDVLAFDLDSDPVRIIVGEAKFRSTPSKAVVAEIVDGLVRSYKGGIPASLQFVADRLFETGNIYLGERVLECATLFALDKLRLDYVGMLMSDIRSAEFLNRHAENSLHRLAMISFGIASPDSIIAPCYNRLDK